MSSKRDTETLRRRFRGLPGKGNQGQPGLRIYALRGEEDRADRNCHPQPLSSQCVEEIRPALDRSTGQPSSRSRTGVAADPMRDAQSDALFHFQGGRRGKSRLPQAILRVFFPPSCRSALITAFGFLSMTVSSVAALRSGTRLPVSQFFTASRLKP
jgi:hypothetical protein